MSQTHPTQPQSDSKSQFADLLASAGATEITPAEKVAGEKVEPTMRALRRILGYDVLDVFPVGLADTVDRFYKVHSDNKALWSTATYEDVTKRNDTLFLMRAYAECAGDKGYTIRTKDTGNPCELRFRVTPRRGSQLED
jgi:hypothetical protein